MSRFATLTVTRPKVGGITLETTVAVANADKTSAPLVGGGSEHRGAVERDHDGEHARALRIANGEWGGRQARRAGRTGRGGSDALQVASCGGEPAPGRSRNRIITPPPVGVLRSYGRGAAFSRFRSSNRSVIDYSMVSSTMMAAPIELTTAEIRRVATSIKTTFARHHVEIESGSELAYMLDELEWAAQFRGLFTDAVVADRGRALGAFLLADQLTHIERWVSAAGEMGRAGRAKLQHLRKNSVNSLQVASGPGLETLFELETAWRLRRPFWSVSLEEPDIVLEHRKIGRVGIACKRPRGRRGVKRSIRAAARQIDETKLPGYIVLSVEGFVTSYLDRVDTQEDLGRHAQEAVNRILEQNPLSIAQALECANVGGVILCGRFVGMVQEPSAWCWAFRTGGVGNHTISGAFAGLQMIKNVLQGELAESCTENAQPSGTADGLRPPRIANS